MSDLHLEFDAELTLPGGDVLVVAGDLCEVRSLRSKHGDNIKRFIAQFSKYSQVLLVMGNHEYYNNCFGYAERDLRDALPSNAALLTNAGRVIDGVSFFGATLWTDYDGGDPLEMLRARQTMNDHRLITYSKEPFMRFTSEIAWKEHRESLAWLRRALNSSKRCVVVTHHGPTLKSIAPRFANSPINSCYVSNLTPFIEAHPQISHWIHGHVHYVTDYRVGATSVCVNARGYVPHEQTGFDVSKGFELV